MRLTKHSSAFLIIICFSFFLGACGFHLRGNVPLPKGLDPMYIDTDSPYDPLVQAIEDSLSAYNITLTNSPAKAKTILHIIDIDFSESLVSVSASTNTRQYSLIETLKMELTGPKGQTIIPLSTLTASNPLTVDSSQVLNASSQKQALVGDMQQALVIQLMSKLASQDTKQALAKEK